ncbi:MAG: DUF4007 family protein [Chloroflexaceae bacterium]|nr:DUF4007 family protein [Chloroflexaceae bacterium]
MRDFKFHNNFTLNRERLSAMLRCVVQDRTASREAVAAAMGVNPYMVEGFRGWLCKTGLGRFERKTYTIAEFGNAVAHYDPYLEQPGTLWGLHYHLVASQQEERAAVWHSFFNEFATPGKSFTSTEMKAYMERTLAHTANSLGYVPDDCKEFLKCYVRSEALGSLGLLHSSKKDTYEVVGTQPDISIVAYVLFDSWQRRFPTFDTLRLTQLCEEPEMIGRIFVMGRTQVRQTVGMLQSKGLLTFADTQHEPVTRRFHDNPLAFLAHSYQSL